MINKYTKIMSIILATLLLSGCTSSIGNDNDLEKDNGKIKIVASFYTMYDIANKIGGDKVSIKTMVPSGTEPHDWEPSSKDIKDLQKADLFLYNGAGMEPWAEKILSSIDNKKLVVVEASSGIDLIENQSKDGDLKNDPHVWLNPLLFEKQMEVVKNALIDIDPSNKEYYEKNFRENSAKVHKLDKEYKDSVSKFNKKDIVVSHAAFGYLCNAYGLNQIAIEGINADSEPSPGRMAEITKFVKDNNIKYIFFEELISPKVANTIAKETGAKTEVLNPIEGLKEEDVKNGKEYFTVMRDNLEVLKKALQD
jgi:zinc transport system substrate-binding protein